jgi:hypothetical protein
LSKSRNIKKSEKEKVDKSSGLKCAWCGVNMKERHHINFYSEGGSNKAENLILLCPNCHTLVHNGSIKKTDLLKRRKELSGCVNRSAGFLSIENKFGVKLGSNIFIETPNLIQSHGENLIVVQSNDNQMLISLILYDKNKNLICWMHENKWWVENEEIFDFIVSKNKFVVISKERDINLEIKIEKEFITVKGCLFINGYKLELGEDEVVYSNPNFNGVIMSMRNCTISNCGGAFTFK